MAIEANDGVWRTIRGRRVFIKNGESLEEALERSKRAYNSQENKVVSLVRKINNKKNIETKKQARDYSVNDSKTEDLIKKYSSDPGKDLENDIGSKLNKTQISKSLDANGVKKNDVKLLRKPITEGEIIAKVSGGDKTKGSCSSVALAYIGNKAGLDVLDFRGGDSRTVFANRRTIKELANLDGVKSFSYNSSNDFTIAKELVSKMQKGKEYYFCVGDHAAIIRKSNNKFEYLELQDSSRNGYYILDNNVLKKRFGCRKCKTLYGKSYETSGYLIDCESLGKNSQFQELLGYINTNNEQQNKGDKGSVK